ncbi:hypothetical protein ASPTUDRAFT_41177 [Aspergillus tubingensis CBS 134.48]|uniref:Uncharacterized protein n=1 Tax=Aspergillus tubingensis (strain CBS 134.48) TaxID=767770 RepID=A0A1L9N790_ASPTC|nr:hypothetical protein ASPTUDRAFT_41177 [Aspergillus tubingensis CBS 134.48]
MPTASGYFTWRSPNHIDADFPVNNKLSKCSIDLDTSLENFGQTPATLSYDSEDQLSGTKYITYGRIGQANFDTTFENDVKIEGSLMAPIPNAVPASGRGTWIQMY